MATADETYVAARSPAEVETTMNGIKKMIIIGGVFVAAGYLLLIIAGVEDALSLWAWADSTKMWFKLGGVGHILVGIFISLVAIIRTLSLVPDRLGARLN